LRPIATLKARQQKQVAQWITDLDDATFAVRQQAMQELEKLGASITATVRDAMKAKNTLEVQRRLELLLEKIEASQQSRIIRALEALEHIANPSARELLVQLAHGAPGALLTREAMAAAERLSKQATKE
jgi:hypothetical protein